MIRHYEISENIDLHQALIYIRLRLGCDVGRGCSLRDIVFSSLPTALMLKAFPFVCVKVDPENRVGVTVKKYSPKI